MSVGHLYALYREIALRVFLSTRYSGYLYFGCWVVGVGWSASERQLKWSSLMKSPGRGTERRSEPKAVSQRHSHLRDRWRRGSSEGKEGISSNREKYFHLKSSEDTTPNSRSRSQILSFYLLCVYPLQAADKQNIHFPNSKVKCNIHLYVFNCLVCRRSFMFCF